jgi:hypothetical protein
MPNLASAHLRLIGQFILREPRGKHLPQVHARPAFKQFKASIHDAKIDVVQEFQEACVFTVEFT